MKTRLWGALAAAVALLPGAASAAPSWWGPSGYMFTPDGTVLPRNCVNLGASIFRIDAAPKRNGTFGMRAHLDTYKAGVGILPNLEFTTAYINHEIKPKQEFGDVWMISAKYAVLPENEHRHFSLVGGIQDATNAIDRTYYGLVSGDVGGYLQRIPYLKRALPHHVRAGVGLASGLQDGVFINAGIPLLPNLELMYEWVQSDLPGFKGRRNNLGGRFRVARGPVAVSADIFSPSLESVGFGGSVTYCWEHHKKGGGDDARRDEYEWLAGGEGEGSGGSLFARRAPVSLQDQLRDDLHSDLGSAALDIASADSE